MKLITRVDTKSLPVNPIKRKKSWKGTNYQTDLKKDNILTVLYLLKTLNK